MRRSTCDRARLQRAAEQLLLGREHLLDARAIASTAPGSAAPMRCDDRVDDLGQKRPLDAQPSAIANGAADMRRSTYSRPPLPGTTPSRTRKVMPRP